MPNSVQVAPISVQLHVTLCLGLTVSHPELILCHPEKVVRPVESQAIDSRNRQKLLSYRPFLLELLGILEQKGMLRNKELYIKSFISNLD